jgi:hypothetical protein
MISELNLDPSGLFSKIKFMDFNDLIDINKPNKSTNKYKSIFDFQINSNIIIETK